MSTKAHNRLPSDAPTDHLPADLPDVPDGWVRKDRDEAPFMARAVWEHELTGQQVTVETNRRPTQMHTPETSKEDTGFNANVYREDGTGRRHLSYELGSKPASYEAAVRFMATYPDGDFDFPELGPWDEMRVDWEADDE